MNKIRTYCLIGIVTLTTGLASDKDSQNSQNPEEFTQSITLINGDFKAIDPETGSNGPEEGSNTQEAQGYEQELEAQQKAIDKETRAAAVRRTKSSIFCVCSACGSWPGCSQVSCPNCGNQVPECETSQSPSGQPGSSNCNGCTGQP